MDLSSSRLKSPGLSEGAKTPQHTMRMSPEVEDSLSLRLSESILRDPLYDYQQCRSLALSQGIRSQLPLTASGKPLKYWKPFTIRPPFLIFLILLSACFIAVIESLYYYSNKNKGIYFVKDLDDLSGSAFFVTQYLPTIIAVLHGILWSMVDLDVKRLEPFYDLGKAGGTDAEALFLEYQYQFPLLVPFRSLKRKHWAVFLSSAIFLISTLVVTPLLSGMFASGIQTVTSSCNMNITATFASGNNNLPLLTPEFLMAAGVVIKDNTTLPPFTTYEYSVLPFIREDGLSFNSTEHWKSTSTAYRLGLTCQPAFIEVAPDNKLYNVKLPPDENYDVMVAYFSAVFNVSVPNSDCGSWSEKIQFFDNRVTTKTTGNKTLEFLAWGRPTKLCGHKDMTSLIINARVDLEKRSLNATALVCTPERIESASAETEVDATTKQITSANTLSDFTLDAKSGKVDLSSFETALFNVESISQRGSDWATFANSPMQPVAILSYIMAHQPDNYFDGGALRRAIDKSYRFLFAMAVSTSSTYLVADNEPISGLCTRQGTAVLIDRTFAMLLDICFAVVFLGGVILCFITFQRRSTLLNDPDSISGILALVADSELVHDMEGLDRANTFQIKEALQNGRFGLGEWNDIPDKPMYKLDWVKKSKPKSIARLLEEQTPRVLRPSRGIWFLATLSFVITAIVVLLSFSLKPNALPVLTSNTFTFGIIWSVIPTLIATLFEPMWGSINRDISVLQPFFNLTRRNMPAARTISQKYAVIPSILAYRAFINRDNLLGTVSLMTFLTGALAISLPGIFESKILSVRASSNFEQSQAPILLPDFRLLNRGVYKVLDAYKTDDVVTTFLDTFLIARAYLSENTPLPSWTTDNISFVPASPIDHSLEFDTFSVHTVGFSASLDCRQILNNSDEKIVTEKSSRTIISYKIPDVEGNLNDKISCDSEFGWNIPSVAFDGKQSIQEFGRFAKFGLGNDEETYGDVNQDPGDNPPMRTFGSGKPGRGLVEDPYPTKDVCPNLLVMSWSRRLQKSESGANETIWDDIKPEDQTIVVCTPRIEAKRYSVRVNKNGLVQTYTAVDSKMLDVNDHISGNTSSLQFTKRFNSIFYPAMARDPTDWAGVLMTNIAKKTSNNYLDPANLQELVNKVYSLSFSIYISNYRSNMLVNNTSPTNISDFTYKDSSRVVMSIPLTIISLCILFMYCITLGFVYVFRGKRFLPRHPTSIAGTIAYFWDSRILDDVKGTYWMSTKQREEHLSSFGDSYGFGWYTTRSGKKVLGVDREPLLADYDGSMYDKGGVLNTNTIGYPVPVP